MTSLSRSVSAQVPPTAVVLLVIAIFAFAFPALAPDGPSPGYWRLGWTGFARAALLWPSALFSLRFVSARAMPPLALAVGAAVGCLVFVGMSDFAKDRWLGTEQTDDPDWWFAFERSRSWSWHWISILVFIVLASVTSAVAVAGGFLWYGALVGVRSLVRRVRLSIPR